MNAIYLILLSCLLPVINGIINPDDAVLAYPYRVIRRHHRSQEGCDHYTYQNRTHLLIKAHDGSRIPIESKEDNKNVTVHFDGNMKSTTTPKASAIEQILSDLKKVNENKTKSNLTGEQENETSDINDFKGDDDLLPSFLEVYHSGAKINEYYYNEKYVQYHMVFVNDPVRTLSVYEPLHKGTCSEGNYRPTTVMETAENRNCILATSAGLFNTKTGQCYGNIVSDGYLVQDSGGVQNVHFGITRKGQLFFGYLSENDLIAEDFLQLVGGVIWVLRDGEPYIDESVAAECSETQETGSLETFATVASARTFVGSDQYGRVVIVQIEGKTFTTGVTLYEAAQLLKQQGVVNAINLDGGGSSTLVINNTLVNYPYDQCEDNTQFNCMRKVTTILCVHEPPCLVADCNGHGTCEQGFCKCRGQWKGDNCDTLECPHQCNGHGMCTEDGCVCDPGYQGSSCASVCYRGSYGQGCVMTCTCENNASCDVVSGACTCMPGYTGKLCQYQCPLGFYGLNCSTVCSCEDSCVCDPVTGACNYTFTSGNIPQAGECFSKKLEQTSSSNEEMSNANKYLLNSLIVVSSIAFVSVVTNLVLIYHFCSKHKTKRKDQEKGKPKYKRVPALNKTIVFKGQHFSSFTSSSTDEETSFMLNGRTK